MPIVVEASPMYDYLLERTRSDQAMLAEALRDCMLQINVDELRSTLMTVMKVGNDRVVGASTSSTDIDIAAPRPAQRTIEAIVRALPSIPLLHRAPYFDVLERLHSHLAPSLVEPYPDRTSPNVDLASSSQVDSCEDAEIHFADTILQVNGQETCFEEHDQISVYLDGERRLVGLRKSEDISTLLALKAFSLSGVNFPAGTIAGVGKSYPTKVLEQKEVEIRDEESVRPFTIAVHQFTRGTGLKPLRHSAYAYTDADRELFAVHRVNADGTVDLYDDRADMLRAHSLEGFIETAHRILSMCGVELTADNQVVGA